MVEFIIAIIVAIVLIIISGFLIYYGPQYFEGVTERFVPVTSDVVDSDGQLNINVDDTEFSQYNNISLSEDVDTMQQRMSGLDFPNNGDDPDNSAVIDEIMLRGNTVFQPSTVSSGVTTTSHAGMNKFTLAGPSGLPYFDEDSTYDIAQTGAADIDEQLARKQQHRSAMNEKAIQGAVRSTRNIYEKYFSDELAENESRVWWSAEAQNFDTDFDPL